MNTKNKTMTTYQMYEEIAENGNKEIIEKYIAQFEEQRMRYGLHHEDKAILTMLKNSLNWIRPISLFNELEVIIKPINK